MAVLILAVKLLLSGDGTADCPCNGVEFELDEGVCLLGVGGGEGPRFVIRFGQRKLRVWL